MTSSDPRAGRSVFVTYLLSYLLAGVTGVVGLGCWLLGRQALLAFMRAISENRYAVGAVDKCGFIAFAIVWLMLVYASAHVYKESVAKGRLRRTWLKVTGLEIAFIVLALAVRFVSLRIWMARLTS